MSGCPVAAIIRRIRPANKSVTVSNLAYAPGHEVRPYAPSYWRIEDVRWDKVVRIIMNTGSNLRALIGFRYFPPLYAHGEYGFL